MDLHYMQDTYVHQITGNLIEIQIPCSIDLKAVTHLSLVTEWWGDDWEYPPSVPVKHFSLKAVTAEDFDDFLAQHIEIFDRDFFSDEEIREISEGLARYLSLPLHLTEMPQVEINHQMQIPIKTTAPNERIHREETTYDRPRRS